MLCSKCKLAVFLAIVTTLVATALPASAVTCSNASLKGVYGLFVTGYDSSGLYQHGVGQINSNGAGKFTGVETVSDDGTIFDNLSLSGTYSIAANCTGTGTIINIKNGTQSHYNFDVDPVGKEVDATETDTGHGTASGYVLALGTATCSVAGVAGTYGFHGGGYMTSGGVLQFGGQYVLDGAGGLTGTETRDLNGTVISAEPITGTYTISSNCRGTITYVFNGSTVNLNTVFVSSGKSFFTIETDAGTVATATAHQ